MRTLVGVLVSMLLVGCSSDPDDSSSVSRGDPAAAVLAPRFEDPDLDRTWKQMMSVMAPGDAWDRVRYLQFDFVVQLPDREPYQRSHRWDRYEGDYRAQFPTEQGELVALFNTNDPQGGQVWLGGVLQEGLGADSLLQLAYGAHINDSYWLIMPYKWTDPGVNLRYVGRETAEDGRTFDVVELSFDDVGLTPQNMYRAYVNSETHLMERWAHYRTSDAEPSFADWSEWQDVGPILLALDRGMIKFENLRVIQGVPPEDAFQPPA